VATRRTQASRQVAGSLTIVGSPKAVLNSLSSPLQDDVTLLRRTNLIVAIPSTPANLFHVLRRQIMLPFRKPAVLMTPKSLLRHPKVRSTLEEFMPGTSFERVIKESGAAADDPSSTKRLVFCSGGCSYRLWLVRLRAPT
jgi:2-oxoglutarate dehydrogenase complex dehydrogenase (E1) component-like enzyme